MDPQTWGKQGWMVLHRLGEHMNSIEEAKVFFDSIQFVLPCPKCQDNFRGHRKALEFPIVKKDVGSWVYKLHKRVSAASRKKDEPAEADVRKKYHNVTCPHPDEWVFIAAIAKTHPGARKASHDYINALQTFMSIWCKYSCNMAEVPSDNTLRSKMRFIEWVAMHKKETLRQVKTCKSKSACSSA